MIQHWNRWNICSFTGRERSYAAVSRLYYFNYLSEISVDADNGSFYSF